MSRRVYRNDAAGLRLTSFAVKVKETDLWIAVSSEACSEDLPSRVEQLVLTARPPGPLPGRKPRLQFGP